MAKLRKSLIGVLMCMIVLLIGVCALTACGSKDMTVTFSIEGKEQTVDVIDGKVAFPQDPTKEYYEFRGWYTTETFDEGTEFTSDTKISESVKVYAYFAPIYVDISLNGGTSEEIKLADLSAKTSEYTADADSKNLTFDGWYIDAAYGTKYSTQDTDSLYARYMATVTFDNGYETVYTANVQLNTSVQKPTAEQIVKYYMDSEDIFYVDEEGNEINFSDAINENTTITVLWKTPNLVFNVNESTGNLYFNGFKSGTVMGINATMGNYPVLSFPGKVTYNGQLKTVESYVLKNVIDDIAYACRKIIVNEGVKQVGGMNGGLNCLVNEVSLPSTLEIIEDSFSNLKNIGAQSLAIPDGAKIIINSFWATNFPNITQYAFDIAVPDSVINLAQVPTNLSFSENSSFSKIGNAIYKAVDGNEKEILIANYDITNGVLAVEEGVKYIQAGAFCSLILRGASLISLPSTWEGISYNADVNEYSYYIAGSNGQYLYSDEVSIANAGKMIIDNLEELERVLIYTTAYPAGASSEIISGSVNDVMKSYTDSAFTSDNKVVFVGEIEEGQTVKVTVRATHRVSGEYMIVNVANVLSNVTALTEEKILSAVNLYENSNYVIVSITQFGEDFTYGVKANCNQYIDIIYEDKANGFTAEMNAEGTAYVITGFDEDTALLDSNNLYKVTIPTEYNGLPVVEIKAGAFKDNTDICVITIPSSVKIIGAEAFMNTTNLATVDIAAGGLEFIGRSAFENSGFETIKLPLSKLKEVEPYAFKSAKLKSFAYDVDEDDIPLEPVDFYVYYMGLEMMMPSVGSYMFKLNAQMEAIGLLKYTGKTTVSMKKNTATDETIDVTVYDVQLVAIAGGTDNWVLSLGGSTRAYADYGSSMAARADFPVFRYEIMEGSVYYLDNLGSGYGIEFGIISKVHKNAFTDINAKITAIKENAGGNLQCESTLYTFANENIYDTWLSVEDFSNTDIFEDGWWEGIMRSDEDYDTQMDWVNHLHVITGDHSLGT